MTSAPAKSHLKFSCKNDVLEKTLTQWPINWKKKLESESMEVDIYFAHHHRASQFLIKLVSLIRTQSPHFMPHIFYKRLSVLRVSYVRLRVDFEERNCCWGIYAPTKSAIIPSPRINVAYLNNDL